MRCSENRPGGRACQRTAVALAAVAIVDGGELVAVLCGDCALRAVARIPGLVVRWLERPVSGRPRPVLGLPHTP